MDKNFPELVFKHLKTIHAEKMMDEGEIRIGNLKSYRQHENKEIEDCTEGIKIARQVSDEKTMVKDRSGNWVEYTGDLIKVLPITIDREIFYPDCYIYCTSLTCSEDIYKEYNACIKIFDIKGLGNYIAHELVKKGLFKNGGMASKVMYIKDKALELNNKTPAYWVKDEHFKQEKEYRIVFPSHINNIADELSPITINIDGIKNFCERIR